MLTHVSGMFLSVQGCLPGLCMNEVNTFLIDYEDLDTYFHINLQYVELVLLVRSSSSLPKS